MLANSSVKINLLLFLSLFYLLSVSPLRFFHQMFGKSTNYFFFFSGASVYFQNRILCLSILRFFLCFFFLNWWVCPYHITSPQQTNRAKPISFSHLINQEVYFYSLKHFFPWGSRNVQFNWGRFTYRNISHIDS